MRTYRYPVNYRKIYEQYYGPIPVDEYGRKYEIHHVDGNHNHNQPSNLKAVTIQEHYDIHYAQEDWAACLLISKRMALSPAEISNLARLNTIRKNLREVSAGTHNFLGGEIQRKWNREKVENGTHHALGPAHNKKLMAEGKHNWLGTKLCPHCQREISSNNYARWHGVNCKKKPTEVG
jgi:hypothetical protein